MFNIPWSSGKNFLQSFDTNFLEVLGKTLALCSLGENALIIWRKLSCSSGGTSFLENLWSSIDIILFCALSCPSLLLDFSSSNIFRTFHWSSLNLSLMYFEFSTECSWSLAEVFWASPQRLGMFISSKFLYIFRPKLLELSTEANRIELIHIAPFSLEFSEHSPENLENSIWTFLGILPKLSLFPLLVLWTFPKFFYFRFIWILPKKSFQNFPLKLFESSGNFAEIQESCLKFRILPRSSRKYPISLNFWENSGNHKFTKCPCNLSKHSVNLNLSNNFLAFRIFLGL